MLWIHVCRNLEDKAGKAILGRGHLAHIRGPGLRGRRPIHQTIKHVIHTDSLEVLDAGLECFTLRLEQIVSAPSSSEQRAIYRDYMHHALHGKVPTKSKRLTLGLARINVGWFAAHAIAIARARQVKRRHLVPQDLMDGLVITSFLLRNNDFIRAFSALDTMVESLFFYNLGVLVPLAPRLAVYDPRLELTKF